MRYLPPITVPTSGSGRCARPRREGAEVVIEQTYFASARQRIGPLGVGRQTVSGAQSVSWQHVSLQRPSLHRPLELAQDR